MADDGKVVEWNGITRLDLPVERILGKALEADLDSAVVIGWGKDGELYFASSYAGGPEVLWLLETAKRDLLAITPEDIEP